ncbi:MAG: alpha/beta hydrolase [Lachnospiraceae bacterium]|nr:alpha/beta hydrolase [Lachnospiraceae bacterium]
MTTEKKHSPLLPVLGGILGAGAVSVGGAYAVMKVTIAGNHKFFIWPDNKPFYDKVTSTYASELWTRRSFDHLKLKAHHFSPKAPSHTWAVVVHGYHGNYTDMMPYACHYLEKGYQVLMPHLRGHGLSQGDYVGFGYHDHFDLMTFIDSIVKKDPQARILLHGMSMGAATVMMASGETLPSQVKCTIADAGFTDAYEQCAYHMKRAYHIPAFPVLDALDFLMKLRYKYSLRQCTPIRSVTHACVPILFIHGEADDFVPYSMMQPLYEACSSEKKMLSVKDAKHVESIFKDPELFWKTADAFAEKYL